MKIGVRAHDFGKKEAFELAGIIRGYGFEAVQLALPKAIEGVAKISEVSDEKVSLVKQAFEGLEISVLGCYIDFTSDDEEVWNLHSLEFKSALRMNPKIGAKLVGSESSFGNISMENKIRTYPVFEKRLDMLLNEAEKYNSYIGIEPVATHTLYSAEWTAGLLKNLDSKRLQVIFDPLNMLTPETVDRQEELWKECIDAFGDKTSVFHLKDGVFDNNQKHSPRQLGKGIARYDILIQWLKKHKKDISILREEEKTEYVSEDVEYIRNHFL